MSSAISRSRRDYTAGSSEPNRDDLFTLNESGQIRRLEIIVTDAPPIDTNR